MRQVQDLDLPRLLFEEAQRIPQQGHAEAIRLDCVRVQARRAEHLDGWTGRARVGSPERPEIRNRRRVCAGTADEHEIVSVEEEPKLWELGEKDVGRGADDASLQSRMFDQSEGGCSR